MAARVSAFGELGIVLEEMGRGLLCAPFFSTAVLATTAILNAGTEAQKQASCCPAIAAGDTHRYPRLHRGQRPRDAAGIAITARRPRNEAERHEELRDRRPHRRSASWWWRAGRARAATAASRSSPSRRRHRPRAHAAQDDGRDAQARAARVQGRRGATARQGGHRRRSLRARPCTQALICLANEMAGGADSCARTTLELCRCACSSAGRSPPSSR